MKFMIKPPKFAYLEKAEKVGIETPKTLFLSEAILKNQACVDLLNNFIDQTKANYYIVRSCISGEDGEGSSFAGHFMSSGSVKTQDLSKAVNTYFDQNKVLQEKICPRGQTNLILQPFVKSVLGGVLFSTWKYFPFHFLAEISHSGPESVVGGEGSEAFLLSKSSDFPSPLKPFDIPEKKLCELVVKLDKIFKKSVDVEWIFDGKQIVVIQIRPVTQPIKALKKATPIINEKALTALRKTSKGVWTLNDFSESFGVLSPLSFAIIKACFSQNIPFFQSFGFRAKSFRFLSRAINGQVYANKELQALFFHPKNIMTPFLQAVRQPLWLQKAKAFALKNRLEKEFDWSRFYKIFAYWNVANFYASKQRNTVGMVAWEGEYEASTVLEMPFPVLPLKDNWVHWRNYYKQWWLWEYDKLKKSLRKEPLSFFETAIENIPKNIADRKTDLIQKYQEDLAYSFFDLPSTLGGTMDQAVKKGDRVVSHLPIKGNAFVIKTPKLFRGNIPRDCILVAPYFDNQWILEINQCKAIILEQGGVLSHSAIVAREKKIAYYIHWKGATTYFEQGKNYKL